MAKAVAATKKGAAPPAPPPRRSVATQKLAPGVPAHLADYESTGKGVPTDQDEFLIPMARVLDPKSPEVEKRGASYVAGAEPGDIYIKNAPVPLIKGETGFLFQACYRDAAVIEWLQRSKGGGGGGGFVARHPKDFLTDPENDDREQRAHPEDRKRMVWVRKSSGNLLVETRYYGGWAIPENEDEPPMPLVLPFASTGHTVAKQWNMLIASKRLGKAKADLWLVYYRVTTQLKQRADQAWYLFSIADAGPEFNGLPTTMWCPTKDDCERGKVLNESMESGERRFNDDDAAAEEKEKDIPF